MTSGGERRLRILGLLGAGAGTSDSTRLCAVSAAVTGTSGAGIMLMSDDLPRGTVCTTDAVSALIEDLQFTLGEGPCVDAHQQQVPVLEPDLADPTRLRWVGFGGPVVAAGAKAVFGFPVQTGVARLGALTLYRTEVGPLSDEQHADALVMADVAAQAILDMQADAPPGQLARSLQAGGDFQHVVHQAAGMVSVQLDATVAQALIRLRAHAFANDRPLTEVAQDVVGRRLRFDPHERDGDLGP